ncbi:hypothetical protein D3C87_2049430 [compost metagenome]
MVIAKIAGIESTAKIRSAISTMIRARKSGVTKVFSLPVAASVSLTKNFSPCSAFVTGR